AECWGGAGGGGGGPCAHFHDADKGGGGGGGAGYPPGVKGGRGSGSYTGDKAQSAEDGTQTAGGEGGQSSTRTTFWTTPRLQPETAEGGDGGDPGDDGQNGFNTSWQADRGLGGDAGAAIDGVSYVKKTGSGDVLGPEVN
ncbi:unnamed protein product, partial [Laminaria digitata]